MTETDLMELAAKAVSTLSTAEGAAIMGHDPKKYRGIKNGGWGISPFNPRSFAQAGRSLMDKKLIQWHPDKRDSRTWLTPLGLAVRSIISSTPETGRGG